MHSLITNIYSFSELSDEAKEHAIEALQERARNDEDLNQIRADEMLDSLKAVADGLGLKLRNYRFGPYSQSCKVQVCGDYGIEDFSGPRALAWLMRLLMKRGYSRAKTFQAMEFPGVCGFTGVCYDEDIIEHVWQELLNGETVRQAFYGVGDLLGKALEKELEYAASREAVLEMLDEKEEQFSEDGSLAD